MTDPTLQELVKKAKALNAGSAQLRMFRKDGSFIYAIYVVTEQLLDERLQDECANWSEGK